MSIFSLLRQGDMLGAIISVLSRAFVVFCCLPIHELAHGFVAYKLGDNTAKYQGRLTFNPLAHLNPIGTIMIFLFGIGYANPVPVNPRNFKNPKSGMALVALAGPVSNVLMAAICGFFYVFTFKLGLPMPFQFFFYFAASVNVSLAVFNLIPVPPLDGSKILAMFLPDKVYYKYMQYERYVMLAVIVLLFIGVFDAPIAFLSNLLMKFILFVPRLLFGV